MLVATYYFAKWTEAVHLKDIIHSRGCIYSGLSHLHKMTWPICNIVLLKARRDWCVGASHYSSAFLGFEKCFLVRKLYHETGGHMLTPKFGTMKVFWTIWTDRPDLSPKMVRPV